MAEDKFYRCWVADCKTPGCKTGIVLHVVREEQPANYATSILVLVECRPFRETCPDCHQENRYTALDMRQVLLANQPLGAISRAYAEASAPQAPEIPAGESDKH
jgi:hypothetical protein